MAQRFKGDTPDVDVVLGLMSKYIYILERILISLEINIRCDVCDNGNGGSNENIWIGQHAEIFRWRWIQVHPEEKILEL